MRCSPVITWPELATASNGHVPLTGTPPILTCRGIWFPSEILAYTEGRKTKKMGLLAEEGAGGALPQRCQRRQPHYSSACRPIDQIAFVAPLFRPSEIQTLLLHAKILHVPVCSGRGVGTNTALNHSEKARASRRAFDKTLSKTTRGIWVQSAKCGKASTASEQSPDGKAKEWPRYDLENKCMMVLDEFDIHPQKEADRKILEWERPHFLTKHCFIWLPHSDDTHRAGHEVPSAERRK